jgi:glucuronokinase
MIITTHAHARAGLVGNPSDGYFGKTIAFIIRNFQATVRLWESPHFEIMPTHGDLGRFRSVADYLRDQRLHGYYGGMRLIKASIKKFHDHCAQQGIDLPDRSFTISYESDIPRLVGLAGSSAIVTATMRALMAFYDVTIPRSYLPTLVLSVERDELGINAGLQDRVIQTFEGIVYMDFNRQHMETHKHGLYEELRPPKLPPLYVAYDPRRAEVSDVAHRNLRELWNRGDAGVHAAMKTRAELTDAGRMALLGGDWEALGRIIDENYEVRRSIMNIATENHRMVQTARAAGASSHFCGSGGAVCGLYRDGRHYQKLVDAMSEIRCSVFRPLIFDMEA